LAVMSFTADFKQNGNRFLERLSNELSAANVALFHWDIDHLCYRSETLERYQILKSEFETIGELLVESEVNGRPISTFKLHEPFQMLGRTIALLELPAPKAGKPSKEGFEHIEVVTPLPLAQLREQYKFLTLDEGGMKKLFNAELEIKFICGAVKFHNLSLESVIRLEKNKKVWNALVQSRVLEVLKDFNPLVVGTFPLELQTEKSDLDIIASAKDQVAFKTLLEENYIWQPHFQAHFKLKKGNPVVVVRFEYDGVPIEIFSQDKPTTEIESYKHFIVEERLLKLGGEKLKSALQTLRAKGEKTEPAFAKVFGLEGDPYEALLGLATKNEAELPKLVV
jgi:predicted metalloenzyme YecM